MQQVQAGSLQGPQDELLNLMTIMYMAIQETLSDPYRLPSVQSQLCLWIPTLYLSRKLVTNRLKLRSNPVCSISCFMQRPS